MRRSVRQHRLRAAEDLFLKVMALVVVTIAISVAVINVLDDGTSPKTQVEGTQANRVQPSPVVVVPSTFASPITTTTTVAPPPLFPDLRGLDAFLAAQDKARKDAAAAAAAAAPPVVPTTPTTAPPPPPPPTSTTSTTTTSSTTTTTTTTKPG